MKKKRVAGWASVRRTTNRLAVYVCVAVASAHAQPKMQPAPVPTTVSPQPGATQAALCMLAECNKPPKPVINGIDPSSTITPGGQVVVIGVHFNSNDQKFGDIVLTIGSKMGGTRQVMSNPVYLQPYREAHLKVLGWSDGHAWGQIPGDISGVMDGPASIQIRRSDGVASDSYTVQFTAAQDWGIYPATDMKWSSCSSNADENQCNGWADFSDPRSLVGSTIVGQHTKFLKSGSPESSDDYYTVNLKNGWTWNHGKGSTYDPVCIGDLFSYEVTNNTPTGGTIKVHWQAVCQITYNISFSIHGPHGVPWK